ncbi:MAG: UTP--glucose-1-phosphate uridylyltransferase [Planctomycetes bacterium]|nr:UTP--glucose-1-phosphate uridylyltransferase [Planctomycetota bacterium]MBL7038708.1 UTP--glucose-1-phosphate uridylyltransferase [Pirellulaceae bacterium]
MSIDIAVVPVAGLGTRLLPATKSQPKEMLPVGRKPVAQHVVDELALSGIRRLLFITGKGKNSIENHFDIDGELITYLRQTGREQELAELDFERQEMEYFYTRQRRQLGLGHAVLCARPLVGNQPFVVALGDSVIGLNAESDIVARMVEQFERADADVVVAFEEVPWDDVNRYGIAQPRGPVDDVFELERLVEKPGPTEAPSNLAVAARYVLSPAIFEKLAETAPGKGDEIQLTDAIQLILENGGKGYGLRLRPNERRFDIGNFGSYFRAFTEFALADPKYGPGLREFIRSLVKEG